MSPAVLRSSSVSTNTGCPDPLHDCPSLKRLSTAGRRSHRLVILSIPARSRASTCRRQEPSSGSPHAGTMSRTSANISRPRLTICRRISMRERATQRGFEIAHRRVLTRPLRDLHRGLEFSNRGLVGEQHAVGIASRYFYDTTEGWVMGSVFGAIAIASSKSCRHQSCPSHHRATPRNTNARAIIGDPEVVCSVRRIASDQIDDGLRPPQCIGRLSRLV